MGLILSFMIVDLFMFVPSHAYSMGVPGGTITTEPKLPPGKMSNVVSSFSAWECQTRK
ncbi:MAG: hypothetical protein JAY75_02865 [Candidatus Thiodiazotropha taylori]|nr:hypothetical protein [Candidatus Thiodiazotropha taylori]MCG8075167.1 hypothetical protein [Candidatus Thiodiazotropha taylori]MCW4224904.1 hypothetical protein [Candidatus Thiodiazotropha endolucinida]MCW4307149.1 hypothetical protein [Candidatus Thiodiazotropha endolucinida]